jgi:hypothetical protein
MTRTARCGAARCPAACSVPRWFSPAIKDEKRVPVEGKLVVTRTVDGGKTFDVLSRGLPDNFAYDLVYRHAFPMASDGTLAFGSTTGNVLASRDRGDSWTVSHHLPPVHAVTFAALSAILPSCGSP